MHARDPNRYLHRPIPTATAVVLGGIALTIAVLLFGGAFGGMLARGAEPPATPATAAEKKCVKLQCRVALALAEAESNAKRAAAAAANAIPAVAPAPRVAVAKLPYSDAYRKASVDQLPLVIYVGTDGPRVDGAIPCKAATFGDAPVPSVLVGFPVGNRLYIDAKLAGDELTAAAVQKAVDVAAKKIEVSAKELPGKVVAPPPLDYQIRADTFVEVACCGCGPGCKCAPGDCPGKCVVAVDVPFTPPGYPPAAPGWAWVADGRGPHGWGLKWQGGVPKAGEAVPPAVVAGKGTAVKPATAAMPAIAPAAKQLKVLNRPAPKGMKWVCDGEKCQLVPID